MTPLTLVIPVEKAATNTTLNPYRQMTWQCTWLLVVSIHRVKGPFAELGIRYFHEDWLQQLACQWNEQLTNIYLTQHKNYRECREYNTMGKTTWSPWSYIFLNGPIKWYQLFSCFFLSSADFFQNQLSRKKSFRNTITELNPLDPDQARCFVGADLGPNWLQTLSADNTSGQGVNTLYPGIQFRLPCTPPPPRTIFHGCQIVHWDPLDGKRRCPQKKFGLGYVKLHGFYANP